MILLSPKQSLLPSSFLPNPFFFFSTSTTCPRRSHGGTGYCWYSRTNVSEGSTLLGASCDCAAPAYKRLQERSRRSIALTAAPEALSYVARSRRQEWMSAMALLRLGAPFLSPLLRAPYTEDARSRRRLSVRVEAWSPCLLSHPQHHIVQGTYRLWGGPGHGPKEELGARPLTRSL